VLDLMAGVEEVPLFLIVKVLRWQTAITRSFDTKSFFGGLANRWHRKVRAESKSST
jgi:hypothetical protein